MGTLAYCVGAPLEVTFAETGRKLDQPPRASLFTPQYQVELERRMKAVTDIELLMLARLAARGSPERRDPDGAGPRTAQGRPQS